MGEFNAAIEESEDVDQMENQMNSSTGQPDRHDDDIHPIMVRCEFFNRTLEQKSSHKFYIPLLPFLC